MFYTHPKLSFITFKNKLEKYDFNDHILGKIEFWRINQIFKVNDKEENKTKISLNINYKDQTSDIIEGIYESENEKIIFEISKGNKNISIFNIIEMELIS